MNPVILNTYRARGGAAKAVMRIYKAVSQELPDIQHLTFEDNIHGKGNNPFFTIYPYMDFGFGFFQTMRRMPFFPGIIQSKHLKNQIENCSPDILHLNWMQGGYYSFNTSIFPKNIPMIWTFHDLWPITGGCAYPGNCNRFLDQCGNCPLFKFPHKKDMSFHSLKRKKRFFQSFPEVKIVAPSSWMKSIIEKSPIVTNHNISVIHNGIDTKSVVVHPKQEARKKCNFNSNKKIILFGAIGATSNSVKGFDILIDALKTCDIENVKLVVFGADYEPKVQGIDITYYPHISDFSKLNTLYSAADVMVVPSREEAFGQTVIEAMAAGTPVVSFRNTGPADIILHKENGFLAEPFEPQSVSKGIKWILNNDSFQLGLNARNHVEKNFDIAITASKYIHLYKVFRKSED